MPHPQPLSTEPQDSRARAKATYESLKETFGPTAKGKIVAIEAESGDYFIGETVLDAASKARTVYPNKTFHFFRVGFPTVYVWR